MPLAVIRGSNEFEDFWCHRGISVAESPKFQKKELKSVQKVVKTLTKNCQKVVKNCTKVCHEKNSHDSTI
jgi:hypothetical protein